MSEATDYYQIHARQDFDRARRRAFVQEMLALVTSLMSRWSRPAELIPGE